MLSRKETSDLVYKLCMQNNLQFCLHGSSQIVYKYGDACVLQTTTNIIYVIMISNDYEYYIILLHNVYILSVKLSYIGTAVLNCITKLYCIVCCRYGTSRLYILLVIILKTKA